MGGFLDKPKTDKRTEAGETDRFRVVRCDMQGYREEMEDASVVEKELRDFPLWSFFGVFDGHAGSKVAQLAAHQLLSFILKTRAFERLANDLKRSTYKDTEHRRLINERSAELQSAICDAFLGFDDYIRNNVPEILEGKDRSGCTAVCAFTSPTHLIIINCGDSRAVLVQNGALRFATDDHKPSRIVEKTRIEKADGFIMLDRVNGELAVSRALGDFDYKSNKKRHAKEQLVSGEPDVTFLERPVASSSDGVPAEARLHNLDELLILACDGVWDVLSNLEAASYFEHRFGALNNITEVAEEALDACLARGSKDNMTLILVDFSAKRSETNTPARRAERELDEMLEKAIRDYLTSQFDEDEPRVEQAHVLSRLAVTDLSNLPPLGFAAKRSKVVALYETISKEMEPQLSACRARANSQSESDTLVGDPRSDDETDSRKAENGYLH